MGAMPGEEHVTTTRRTFMAGSLAATAATALPLHRALAQTELKLASFDQPQLLQKDGTSTYMAPNGVAPQLPKRSAAHISGGKTR